jgi:hypothetical protein
MNPTMQKYLVDNQMYGLINRSDVHAVLDALFFYLAYLETPIRLQMLRNTYAICWKVCELIKSRRALVSL